jgi:ABC-type branched-subunit amino acid transport system ATPase component
LQLVVFMSVLNRLSAMAESAGGAAEMAAPLLRVAGLCHAFGGQQVLKDVNLELRLGEVVLLRGANGSGKTTLLNILTGNLVPDRGTIELHTRREPVRFEFPLAWGKRGFSPERLAQLGLGRTWQDVRLFDTQSLIDNIAVATPHQVGENPLRAILQKTKTKKQEQKVQEASYLRLSNLGLGERVNSSADKISLGQTKRVAIARAIQSGVKVLCLDEPLAGLDSKGIYEVMQMLERAVQEDGLTLIVVEHVFNIPYILELATSVWTMKDGHILIDSTEAIINEQSGLQPEGINDWLTELAEGGSKITKYKLVGGAVLYRVRMPNVELGKTILSVKDLVVNHGKRLVLGFIQQNGFVEGLSFYIQEGELAILQAPNGWGKTTLMNSIVGLTSINKGEIRLYEKLIHKLPTWQRVNLGITLLQSRNNNFPGLTVHEMLRISKIAENPVQIKAFLQKKMSDLSGGERQKVVLACLPSSSKKSIRLLDEPFAALDTKSVKILQQQLVKSLTNSSVLITIPLEQ